MNAKMHKNFIFLLLEKTILKTDVLKRELDSFYSEMKYCTLQLGKQNIPATANTFIHVCSNGKIEMQTPWVLKEIEKYANKLLQSSIKKQLKAKNRLMSRPFQVKPRKLKKF